jgi:hypothetical protein
MSYDLVPAVLARGADTLNVSSALLRRFVQWIAELPPSVREELFEKVRRSTPQAASASAP